MMAREAFNRFAKARALSTPPASGETITISFFELSKVFQEHGGGKEMVHRDIEEPLNLAGMEIHGQDPRGSCRRDQVSHQLGGDGGAGKNLPVLPGIAVVGKNGRNPLRRGPFEGIDQDQKFHQIVIDRITDRLDHEDIHSPDALMDLDIDLPVAEGLDHRFSDGRPQMAWQSSERVRYSNFR